jgi:predicted peptidase
MMLCKLTCVFSPLFLLVACAKTDSTFMTATGFLSRTVTVSATTYRYQVYVPADFTPKKKWPVILFLHGAGERGDDSEQQTQVGIGPAIRQHPERFPCIVVFPQCRFGDVWFGDMEAQALKALEQSLKEFNGDAQRVCLTGISMGGYGTWYLAAQNPGRFAAIAPICGGVVPPPTFPFPPDAVTQVPTEKPYETIAQRIGKTPVWIFHGDADPTIPVTESRQMAAALEKLGGNVKYSEYEGVNHNSWDRAYGEPEFVAWLLSMPYLLV